MAGPANRARAMSVRVTSNNKNMTLFDLQQHIKKEKYHQLRILRKKINKKIPDYSIAKPIAINIINDMIFQLGYEKKP